ncbi:MAG TPA: response regulator transcription factor [Candidatus Acidoferrum sp.]|nr:response regulator transcription factor [Candidatus Acidoferrum sp.]
MKPGDRPIRVLVADDSATALTCICRYLEFEGVFEIVGTASDGLRLVQKAGRLRPDLVLTDISMPLLNGLEATTELRRLFPQLRIVVVTQLSGLSLKEECLRRGADGFVEKGQIPERLMEEVSKLFPKDSALEQG